MLESKFLEDNAKNGRSIMSLGIPESGKTFVALKYIKHSLQTNRYDEYHCVIPQFDTEQNNSYAFMKNYKEKIFIYNQYHAVLSERMDNLRKKKKIMFFIDDATAELLNNVDTTFIKLWTTTRHSSNIGLTMWIVLHSAKKAVPPSIRQNLKYLFIYRIESAELLEDTIFKEFLSLQYTKNDKKFIDFVKDYSQVMDNNEYGCVLVARKMGIDFEVNSWNLLKFELTPPKVKPKVIQNRFPISFGRKNNF